MIGSPVPALGWAYGRKKVSCPFSLKARRKRDAANLGFASNKALTTNGDILGVTYTRDGYNLPPHFFLRQPKHPTDQKGMKNIFGGVSIDSSPKHAVSPAGVDQLRSLSSVFRGRSILRPGIVPPCLLSFSTKLMADS